MIGDVADALSNSGGNLASDPVFLGVFFLLGYRKLFSDSSNTTIGSIFLIGSLSVSAAWFIRSCGFMVTLDSPDTPGAPDTPPDSPKPSSPPASAAMPSAATLLHRLLASAMAT